MRILFHAEGENSDAWLAGLQKALPDAQLRIWKEGDNDAADYAVVWKPAPAMLHSRPDLKAIFNLGAGTDAILRYGNALPAGVMIVRLDDAGMGVQMAEYVTHAVLRYFRRFDEYEMQARSGHWRRLQAYRKEDFPIGILGLGVLGSRIADALAHFDFPLRGWSRTMKHLPGVKCYAGLYGLAEFLQQSRVLVCVLPLTAETKGILNRSTLAQLPPGAYLVNIARGAHVVESDLLDLLQQGHIAGATLDVFSEEPLPASHAFLHEPAITMTPHIAALTLLDESVQQIAAKIRLLEQGRPIAGVVDLERGY